MGIVGLQFVNVAKEGRDCEGVRSGVDLMDLFLSWRGCLFFNNGLDFVAIGALPDHAAIAGWILEMPGEDGHGRSLSGMEIAKVSDGGRSDQRSVAIEHDDLIVARECITSDHQSVARAFLGFLLYELYPGMRDRMAHVLGFVTNDGVNILCGDHLGGCSN